MTGEALDLHRKLNGKIEVRSKIALTPDVLALVYTPGVADVSRHIAEHNSVRDYTMKRNAVAIVTDGSAVLGLGNIGPEAALPVMEGKALLFKEFANIDAFPLCLATQDAQEIITTVRHIAPVFGGINLEDIAAPRCFAIEEALQDLGIPVMHDDQHGTAVVVLAALLNAARVTGKRFHTLRVVVSGAGAAGTAVARLLTCSGYDQTCMPVSDIVVCDRQGIIHQGRELPLHKQQLCTITNRSNRTGTLADALEGADVFVGVSSGGLLTEDMIRRMNDNPIVFALANPTPEIAPDEAAHAGAAIVATGRSDYPNQVNNALAFPGIFRGLLDAEAPRVTNRMKLAAAQALSRTIDPDENHILPSVLDKNVTRSVADAVRKAAEK